MGTGGRRDVGDFFGNVPKVWRKAGWLLSWDEHLFFRGLLSPGADLWQLSGLTSLTVWHLV